MAEPRERMTAGEWAVILLGVVLVVFGVPMLVLGVWLITLGGSWYYALAAIGILATAWFLFRRDVAAFWIYFVTFAATVVWALWERGLDGWAQLPRLVGPTIVMVLMLLALPVLRRRMAQERIARTAAAGAVGLLATVGAGLVYSDFRAFPAAAQANPPAPAAASPTPVASSPSPALAGASASPLPVAEAGADWPAWGGSNAGTRYSPLTQINTSNVGQLTKLWTFRTGDLPDEQAKDKYSWEGTPIKVGDRLFLCSAKNIVIALDAGTGKEIWRYDPKVSDDAIPYGATCHAVAYFSVPGAAPDTPCANRVIEGTLDARLIAVDAETGQTCADFGNQGAVNLLQGIGRTVPGWYALDAVPVIVRGVVVVGAQVQDGQSEDSPSGVVRGFSATTGKLVWAWDLGNPAQTGVPPPGKSYTRDTPNMWTAPAADEQLGLVYLPLGNSPGDYYGGHRTPADETYNSSIVAVDVTTGKDIWHFQTIHHDLWDYDLGSQPSLVDFPTDKGTVPALILSSKQGQIYALDRRNGKSLFPVIERPAPQGGVEPERLSKTQPFSGYANLTGRDLTEADMWGITPLDQLWCRVQFRRAAYQGTYTPPTADRYFIEYPSYNGGSDWGSLAVDQKDGILVANYNDMANYTRLISRDEADKMHIMPIYEPHAPANGGESGPQTGAPYAVLVNPGWQEWTGLMCKQPPYGHLRAIDLKSGRTLWDQPFGLATENGPFHIPSKLPVTIGTPNNGGAVVTAGGLIFIAAATDNLIRAVDIKTGKTLWSDKLPAGGQATPMTYEANGQQFLVITAGGHHFMRTPIGDYVIAYAIPQPGQ
jgi:quinoprotein glucose dehydrogenase